MLSWDVVSGVVLVTGSVSNVEVSAVDVHVVVLSEVDVSDKNFLWLTF